MTSALFDPLFGATAVDAALDDRAWLAALCEVETALARACAQVGLIPLPVALEIGAAASVGIERGLTTQQALYAYLRQYHKRGHAEREVR